MAERNKDVALHSVRENSNDEGDMKFQRDPFNNLLIPGVLPHEKMYSIQVGAKVFKVSGASLSSDCPSYFTSFFLKEGNGDKVLFIDRSPTVFEKIYLHLQGYHIKIENEFEFVYLFSDANYFSLPKLKTALYENDIFTAIGSKSFRISKDLITSEGNFPNFFSICYNTLFQDPTKLSALKDILRPPPQEPPVISNHSPELFEELLSCLQGKDIIIKNEIHRENLLQECRYYRFLALEQKLISHKILLNPFTQEEEIIINLKDIKKKGLLLPSNALCHTLCEGPHNVHNNDNSNAILKYSRPFADKDIYRNLVIQIKENSEISLLLNSDSKSASLHIINKTAKKLYQLLSFDSNNPLLYDDLTSTLTLAVELDGCHCIVNDREMNNEFFNSSLSKLQNNPVQLKILNSQWKVATSPDHKLWLIGIMIDTISHQTAFYKKIGLV
ncbi:hypothetical protein PACTADRAFT_78376 [Pachysolen tannophilus NRRL Y-2460]|uniref:Potassium channel tetramerisation-type BTB domain-containing protein n=1 Tax=Pachysolen tannophilus NRRL Y-2460 TaxID=669874 RepID=A0A1E4U1U2_PACTA|nr:hypothetical protein PACTADRAFT_78376 [Pachysolen tannophilus NRRL Y-2460]